MDPTGLDQLLTTAWFLGGPLHEEHAGGGVRELLETRVQGLLRRLIDTKREGTTGSVTFHLLGQLRGMGTI